jgi:hypothetical protein
MKEHDSSLEIRDFGMIAHLLDRRFYRGFSGSCEIANSFHIEIFLIFQDPYVRKYV